MNLGTGCNEGKVLKGSSNVQDIQLVKGIKNSGSNDSCEVHAYISEQLKKGVSHL